MSQEAIIHTDGREMSRFLAQLAEALDAAGRPTAEAFAEFYGFTGAAGWVAGMLEEYAAAPPIEIRVAPAASIQARPAPPAGRSGGVRPQAGHDSPPAR